VVELPATKESFQMQEHTKIAWRKVLGKRGMIELFPLKCRDEILRCGGSVWAGIVTKHHNTPTKHVVSLVHFVFIRKHI
jgi:hypothetical protein